MTLFSFLTRDSKSRNVASRLSAKRAYSTEEDRPEHEVRVRCAPPVGFAIPRVCIVLLTSVDEHAAVESKRSLCFALKLHARQPSNILSIFRGHRSILQCL